MMMTYRLSVLLLLLVMVHPLQAAEAPGSGGQFTPSKWAALKRDVPQWQQDAKFGIYAHWGLGSLTTGGPKTGGRDMYRIGSKAHQRIVAQHGSIQNFGYKDYIPQLTAEGFDAEQWATVIADSGARYAGLVAVHHDCFAMWDSDVHRWNAGDMGPNRDFLGELFAALRKREIKTLASFHHGRGLAGAFWRPNPHANYERDSDMFDPKYYDFYGRFDSQQAYEQRWLAMVKEAVTRYRPDQVWFDSRLYRYYSEDVRRAMVAFYYDFCDAKGIEGVISYKASGEPDLPDGVAMLDIERGKLDQPHPRTWQTDDSVSPRAWFWMDPFELKSDRDLVHELIDIVSKNGVLLLNMVPAPDGSIPSDQRKLLRSIGDWLRVNGRAIYATRPWHVHGEGPHLAPPTKRGHDARHRYTADDIRYTCSKDGKTLYAILLGRPTGSNVTLRSFADGATGADVTVADVSMIGVDQRIEWRRTSRGLTLGVPDRLPSDIAVVYAIDLK